jgi:hypothetical protein
MAQIEGLNSQKSSLAVTGQVQVLTGLLAEKKNSLIASHILLWVSLK